MPSIDPGGRRIDGGNLHQYSAGTGTCISRFIVAKIWEKVLGIESIGVTDNLFEKGGHSLLAIRLLAEIGRTFDKNLPLSAIFQSPTVEQLANILHIPSNHLGMLKEPHVRLLGETLQAIVDRTYRQS